MMGTSSFSEDFKRDAVAQITDRGYPVAEVSQRLGVSPHLLYAWKKKFLSRRTRFWSTSTKAPNSPAWNGQRSCSITILSIQ